MAPYFFLLCILLATVESTPARRGKKQSGSGPKTCPGFPGYCSESYPGDTCLVVCARGRNNVPECQEDGTWTDIPRCIEHEPGIQEQVPGVCPGIPGYCSLNTAGGLCTFECPIGPHIRSTCTPDGTWEPYPTCQGDIRETQDGCNPCPGPLGGPRNRTAEAGGNSRSNTSNNKSNSGNSRNQSGNNRSNTSNNRSNTSNNRSNTSNNSRNNSGNRRNNGGNNRNNNSNNRSNTNNSKSHGGSSRSNSASQPRQSSSGHGNSGKTAPAARRNSQPAHPEQPRGFASGSNTGNSGSRPVSSGSRSGSNSNSISCPGSVLQSCIDVCPGFSARVFAACVSGCAKRCPGRK